jgi:glycosyltransferase involved in cell wall biosynthesis
MVEPEPVLAAFRVSVVIPVYNGGTLVGRAVASLMAQDYAPGEILLINDGSTDGSADRLRNLAATNPTIKVLENAKNMGLSWTLNRGLRSARGELVLILHQDCALIPSDWIGRAVQWFHDPNVISVVGNPQHSVDQLSSIEREFWVLRNHTMIGPHKDASADRGTLFSENKCDLFRRERLLGLGGFEARLRDGGEDQVLAWRLRMTPFVIIRDPRLLFSITLGLGGHLGQHLRRDVAYGRQMRQILWVTRFGALRRSRGAPVDSRLVNRTTGVLWILTDIAALALLIWTRIPWIWLLVGMPPLLRWLQLTVRGVRERRIYRLGIRELVKLGAHGLLADLAYGVGLIAPTRRRKSDAESPPTA